MMDLVQGISLWTAKCLIAFENLLIKRTSMMEMYVVCKRTREFLSLEAIEVEEYIDKNNGTAVKYMCPFCNEYHISMVMERPHG